MIYLHLLLEAGDHIERIYIQSEPTEATIRTEIEAGLKRGVPQDSGASDGGAAPHPAQSESAASISAAAEGRVPNVGGGD